MKELGIVLDFKSKTITIDEIDPMSQYYKNKILWKVCFVVHHILKEKYI